MFISVLLSFSLWASAHESNCYDGFYDLGPDAAAISFLCHHGSFQSADLDYCNRDKLLRTGVCTGLPAPLPCTWQDNAQNWLCEQGGNYPLVVIIQNIGRDRISYRFKSKFNSGELIGEKIYRQ